MFSKRKSLIIIYLICYIKNGFVQGADDYDFEQLNVTEYEKLEQQQQQQQQQQQHNDDEHQERLQYRKLCTEEQNSNNEDKEENLQIKYINERDIVVLPRRIETVNTDEISSFDKLKLELNKSINDKRDVTEQDDYYDRMADAILYNENKKIEKENNENNFETSMQHLHLKTMQQSHLDKIVNISYYNPRGGKHRKQHKHEHHQHQHHHTHHHHHQPDQQIQQNEHKNKQHILLSTSNNENLDDLRVNSGIFYSSADDIFVTSPTILAAEGDVAATTTPTTYFNNNKDKVKDAVYKIYKHGLHKQMRQYNRQSLRTQYNTYPVISTHHREENGFDCYQDVSDQYKIVCGTKANHNRRNRPNKWPNFTRLRKHLQHEQEDDIYVPPYVKKFRRRNKQLLDLLEGTISPSEATNNLPIYSASYRISSKQQRPLHQLELDSSLVIHGGEGDNRRPDLFQEQRKVTEKPIHFNVDVDEGIDSNANTNDMLTKIESNEGKNNRLKNTRAEFTNDIPGDGEDILYKNSIAGEKINKNGNRMTGNDGTSISNYKLSPKSDRFIYHRVVSPKLIGVGDNYGDIKKQRLPFVAITDKRIGPPSFKSKITTSH